MNCEIKPPDGTINSIFGIQGIREGDYLGFELDGCKYTIARVSKIHNEYYLYEDGNHRNGVYFIYEHTVGSLSYNYLKELTITILLKQIHNS